MGLETIDLYYAHEDDPNTPLEETLGAFQQLIDTGKIRYAAASNYSAERLQQGACALASARAWPAIVALQPHYNLLERGYETRAGADLRALRARLPPLLRSRSWLSHAASTAATVKRSIVPVRRA